MKLLTRQIQRAIGRLAPGAEWLSHSQSDWRAITFSGSRHELVLHFAGAEAVASGERFCDALPTHKFTIPGHMVVEGTITRTEHRYGRRPTLTVTAALMLLREL